MGVYFSLAYGIALTDDFGGQLDTIPPALFDFGSSQKNNKTSPMFIQSMPTVEDYFLVLGVDVKQGSDEGETWTEGRDTLKDLHEAYLALLEQCPEDVRSMVEEHDLVPRLCVLAGDF